MAELGFAEGFDPMTNRMRQAQMQAIVRDTVELFGVRILDVRQRSVSREATERPKSEDEMASQEDVDDDE
jgi:hypothetical protein